MRFRWEGRTRRTRTDPHETRCGPQFGGQCLCNATGFLGERLLSRLVVHELLEPLLTSRCTGRFGPIEWTRAFWVPYYRSMPPSAVAEAHIEFASNMIGGGVPDIDALPQEGEIQRPTYYKEWIIGWPTSEESQQASVSLGKSRVPRAVRDQTSRGIALVLRRRPS